MEPKAEHYRVRIAESDADIERCFTVMVELRTHLEHADFVPRVRRQMRDGFRLAYVEHQGEIVAVAGYRISDNLFHGRFLYVDDLVTTGARRSEGHGKLLLDWLARHARENGCRQLELDSGVQRFDAHRFYLREGMQIRSHHFSLSLDGTDEG